MEKPSAAIADLDRDRIDKIPFRPDTTRVIKPRSLEEVDAIEEETPCQS